MRDRFISVNGLRLHYIEWGNPHDPPLVLVHGGTAHAYWWKFFVDALGGHYRVLALDLRGHGDSEWADPPQYDITTHAADLRAFISALDLTDLTLMGHSYGGFVAMSYASMEAKRLVRLIIIDIAMRLSERGARYLNAMCIMPRPAYPSLHEAVEEFQLVPRENGARPEILAEVARRSFRQLETGTWEAKFDRRVLGGTEPCDFTGVIRALKCPVFFVRGEESKALSSAGATVIRRAAPNVEVRTISNAHHHVMLDQPEALAEMLRRLFQHSSRAEGQCN